MSTDQARPRESAAGAGPAAVRPAIKAIVFAVVSVTVLVTTQQWTTSLKASVDGDLLHLLVFPYLFVRYDQPAVIHYSIALAVGLAAAFVVPRAWFDRLARWISDNPAMFGLCAFAALAAGSYLAYDDYPLALDEFAQYFQAQIFAAGKLHGQYPPNLVRGLLPLPNEFIIYSAGTGQTMTGYWPGFPLLLTPFMFLGIPWVTNPIVGVIGILLMRHLALRLMPETPAAAGWAMLFMLASPAFSINAISYYTMNVYLTLGLAYATLLMEPTPRRLLVAGLVGSFALVQHNPFPHTVFAIPWIVWLGWRPGRVRSLFWLGLGYLPLTIVLLFGWWWLKGQLLVESFQAAGHSGGTVSAMSALVPHSAWGLPRWTVLLERVWATLKVYLWAVPGLAIICFYGYRRLRAKPVARLLAWSAIVTYVAFLFVTFDQGHGWGYRYFHPAWGVLPLFGAAWVTEPTEGFKWAPLMGSLAVISLLVLTPIRMSNVHHFIKLAESQGPPRDPDKHELGFVNVHFGDGRYYSQDAIRNDPFLRNPSIRMMSRGPDQDEQLVRENFPNATLVTRTENGSLWDLSR